MNFDEWQVDKEKHGAFCDMSGEPGDRICFGSKKRGARYYIEPGETTYRRGSFHLCRHCFVALRRADVGKVILLFGARNSGGDLIDS